jgi:hypothetical protein
VMHGATVPTSTEYTARRKAERRSAGRALIPALVASAVLHLAALLLITYDPAPELQSSRGEALPLLSMEPVMRAYDIAPVAVEVAPLEAQLRERELLRQLPTPQRQWGVPESVSPVAPSRRPEPGSSAAERLRYRMGSAEVWRPQAPLPPAGEPSPDEVVRGRVASQLQEYNDSVSAEAAARARATDWTVKDKDGGRWGVSPGAIHLGSVTLPLPFELSPPPEVAARVRSWSEIQDQAARVETREVFDERVRAIRERAEQERARRAAGGG